MTEDKPRRRRQRPVSRHGLKNLKPTCLSLRITIDALVSPLLALAVLPSPLCAMPMPGSLLKDNFPEFSTQATVDAATVGPDGSVFLLGDFHEVDGTARPGLAKLTPGGHLDASFAPTEAVAFESQRILWRTVGIAPIHPKLFALPEGRLMVYGTHAFLCQPRPVGGLTYQLSCNPEAPEIVRRLEASTDLETWRPARADQVRMEVNRPCLTWTLLPGHPKLFTRVLIK